jgi:twitching motility protein PilT
MGLNDLIATASSLRASDLHLEAGTPLVVRVKGELLTVGETIPGARLIEMGKELLGPGGWRAVSNQSFPDSSRHCDGSSTADIFGRQPARVQPAS